MAASTDPLFPNPGGKLAPEDLVGRADELQALHERVTHGGVYVRGERRVGKTSLLNKLAFELRDTALVVTVSAQTSRLDIFEDRLLKELREHRLTGSRVAKWEKEVGGELNLAVCDIGIKLRGSARRAAGQPPAELDVISLLLDAAGKRSVVLIIDEIAELCWHLKSEAAAEFLRNLRAARQSSDRLAVVLAGSIGLHHALPSLTVINDLLPSIDIGPLNADEATELVERLMLGIGMDPDPDHAAAVVRETAGYPYFIQAVMDEERRRPCRVPVADLIDEAIRSDEWNTSHYVTRIDVYYGDEAPLARASLDILATSGSALTPDELRSALVAAAHEGDLPSREQCVSLMDRLEADHYLVREGNASTMTEFMARIWRIHRRL